MIPYLIFTILGLSIGSFLNVVIARLPLRMSVIRPRSLCLMCASPILRRDLIPVFSYIRLGGRCRQCNAAIPRRYLLVELAVAAIFLILFHLYGATALFLKYALLAMTLVAASEIDLACGIIPNRLLGWSFMAGMLGALSTGFSIMQDTLLAALSAGVVMLLVRWLGQFLFAQPGMGMGDVKLAAVAGLYLGWPVFMGLYMAIALAGLRCIVDLSIDRRKNGARFPFGPYMALGMLSILPLLPQLHFVAAP